MGRGELQLRGSRTQEVDAELGHNEMHRGAVLVCVSACVCVCLCVSVCVW